MKISFSKQFEKQIDSISDSTVKELIGKAIQTIRASSALREIRNIKKLKGHKSAYRMRIGNYRIGFYFEKGEVFVSVVAHRKDIYKHFP